MNETHKEVSILKNNIETSFAYIKNTFIDITRINHAITLNIINNRQSKEEIAKILMTYYISQGLTIPEWEKYNIPKDIIIELEKLYHKSELEKLNKEINP